MAMHLFSTPVQCTRCGTVVDDPTVDRCPKCGNLLKERRTPSRIAGVERRYGQLRFLVGALIEVALDIEENTRAAFRLQQRVLEILQTDTTAERVVKE